MVGLFSGLFGAIAYQGAKVVISILLLVAAVFVGKSLREMSDKKKAAKKAAEEERVNTDAV